MVFHLMIWVVHYLSKKLHEKTVECMYWSQRIFTYIYLQGKPFKAIKYLLYLYTVISIKKKSNNCKKKKIWTVLCEKYLVYRHGYSFFVSLLLWLSSVFSLFTSKTGKRVFQTCRVIGAIIGYGSSQCIIWDRNMPHFILVCFIQIL